MTKSKKLCSEISLLAGEQLFGTAPFVEHWFLLEYSGNWKKNAFDDSSIPAEVKKYVNNLLESFDNSRLQLINSDRADDTITFYYARSTEFEPKLYKFKIKSYYDILDIDFQKLIEVGEIRDMESDEKLVLICTHGSYDRCCGKYGVKIYNILKDNKELNALRSTHVGSHRFSANLVMLPEGIYYGRVNQNNLVNIIRAHLIEEVFLDCLRGRSCYSYVSQVADFFLRKELRRFGIYDFIWEFEKDRDLYTAVEFRSVEENVVYSVNSVVLNEGLRIPTSCGDEEPKYIPQFYFYSLIPYEKEEGKKEKKDRK